MKSYKYTASNFYHSILNDTPVLKSAAASMKKWLRTPLSGPTQGEPSSFSCGALTKQLQTFSTEALGDRSAPFVYSDLVS